MRGEWSTNTPAERLNVLLPQVVYRDAELYSPIKPSAMGRTSIGATGDFQATETGSAGVSTFSGQESKDLTRLAKLRKRMRHAISTYNGELQQPSHALKVLLGNPRACTRA